MLYFVKDSQVSLTLVLSHDFENGPEFTSANDGTFSYTVRDHAGVPIGGLEDVPVSTPDGMTEVGIVIPAIANNKSLPLERRTVTYRWQSGEEIYNDRLVYYLTDWVNIDGTPEDVRSALGVSKAELPDRDINLLTAYLLLRQSVGVSVDTAIAAGDASTIQINRAIVLREALRLLPSLRLRATKTQATGSESFQRFTIDWEALKADLEEELGEQLPEVPVEGTTGSAFFYAYGRGTLFDG